jgi:hypothetical protein
VAQVVEYLLDPEVQTPVPNKKKKLNLNANVLVKIRLKMELVLQRVQGWLFRENST